MSFAVRAGTVLIMELYGRCVANVAITYFLKDAADNAPVPISSTVSKSRHRVALGKPCTAIHWGA